MSQESKEEQLQGSTRFKFTRQLAKTLQGRIYAAIDKRNGQNVVVKETWKQLVEKGITRDGHKVPEDFKLEKKILNYLSNLKDVDPGFVRMIDEWEEDQCFYYAMEFAAGGELFDHVKTNMQSKSMMRLLQQASKGGQKPTEKPNEWQETVKMYFQQLVQCVAFMHQNGVCHLDLSLENTMIADEEKSQIKIIDFGVGQLYPRKRFQYNKRVGKTGYMAPETYASAKTGHNYDARSADVWCLGVMLFMMLVGAPPYDSPSLRNPAFKFIVNGRVADVLKHWKRLPLMTPDALDLLNKIFKWEKHRISMEDLLKHPFVNLESQAKQYAAVIGDEVRQLIDLQKQDKPEQKEHNPIKSSTGVVDTPIKAQQQPQKNYEQFTTADASKFKAKIDKTFTKEELVTILGQIEKQFNKLTLKQQSDQRDEEEAGANNTSQIEDKDLSLRISELNKLQSHLSSRLQQMDTADNPPAYKKEAQRKKKADLAN